MHNILALTDRALAAYLESQDIGIPCYPFKRSIGKEVPCVIIHSSPATPIAPFSATSDVEVAVMIRTPATVEQGQSDADPVAASDEIVNDVIEALHRIGEGEQSGGTIADAITEAAREAGIPTFTCQGYGITSQETSIESGDEVNVWTDTINLTLSVCPANAS